MKHQKGLAVSLFPVLFLVLSLVSGTVFANSLDQILERGQKLETAGQPEQALEIYTSALQQNQAAELFNRAGTLLGKMRRYSEAEQLLQRALQIHASDISLLSLQGLVLIRLKKNTEAVTVFEKILSLDPSNEFALSNLKQPKPSTRHEEGPLSLEEQLKLAKENFRVINELDKWDTEPMIGLYREVIKRCPDTDFAPEACWRLANLFLRSEVKPDHHSAIEVLEHMLAKYSNVLTGTVRIRLANSYEEIGAFHKMAEQLHYIMEEDSEMSDRDRNNYLVRYAEALRNAGQTEDARTVYEQVASSAPANSPAAILANLRLEQAQ